MTNGSFPFWDTLPFLDEIMYQLTDSEVIEVIKEEFLRALARLSQLQTERKGCEAWDQRTGT